jgi:hypothetical protein
MARDSILMAKEAASVKTGERIGNVDPATATRKPPAAPSGAMEFAFSQFLGIFSRMKTLYLTARRAFAVVLCAACLAGPKAFAGSDTADLEKAVTNFFTVMDKLVIEVPNAKDAAATVKVLDSWTGANNGVADAGDALVLKHPDFKSNPPPWLAPYFTRCVMLSTNYAPASLGIGTLIKNFHKEPGVAAAITRYQQSLMRLDELTKLGVIDRD